MAVQRIYLDENPGQSFSIPVNGKKVDFLFRYNFTTSRFWVDIKIDDTFAIQGRTLVLETDVLDPLGLGIGKLVAVDIRGLGREPTLENIASGAVEVLFIT